MKNCLLTIGSFPERALPTILSAFSCGAVSPVSELDIFHLSAPGDPVSSAALARGLSRCHDILADPDKPQMVFPGRFSFSSCEVRLVPPQDFAPDEDSAALLAALRGKNLPLSFQQDRDVIEWSFSCLLQNRTNDSLDPFLAFLAPVRAELSAGGSVRLALLFDPADPFSAGIFFALLPWLRAGLPGSLFLSALALAETTVPRDEAFLPALDRTLRDLRDRRLLRAPEEDHTAGADSAWLISMPSTILDSDRSHHLAFFAAARALSGFFAPDQPPPVGLHTCEAAGSVSLAALGNRAPATAAFIEYAVWLISDLLPSLRDYLARPSRFRSLPNSRNGLFRTLFSAFTVDDLSAAVNLVDETLRSLLGVCLSFVDSVPAVLRWSPDGQALWQKAVDACGRYITVVSEIDVTRAEIDESGLKDVMPVHRDSMADTDEEALRRKLAQMDRQLEAETALRNEALSAVGPFRAMQARRDCCLKCQAALASAEKKMAALSPDTTEHLVFAMQDRRIRLLRAAVARGEEDLRPQLPAAAQAPAVPPAAAVPVVLTAQAAAALRKMLSARDPAAGLKEMKDCLPVLLQDIPLPDTKELQKSLLSLPAASIPSNPIAELLRMAWHVCVSVSAGCDFRTEGDWPAVPLLPDLLPAGPVRTVPDLLALLPRDEARAARDEAEKRGLLAMLFLAHYKRRQSGDPKLISRAVPADAVLTRCWLSGGVKSPVHILSLSGETGELPFAVAVPGRLFLPARRTQAHAALIPAFVTWYAPDTGLFGDPCAALSEGDRALLSARIRDILAAWPAEGDSPARLFLSDFLASLSAADLSAVPDPKLSLRLKAVCGLQPLPACQDLLARIPRFYDHFLGVDPVAAALTGDENFRSSSCTDFPDEVLYTWRGIPFAREHSRLILDSAFVPGEADALAEMESECRTLSAISDDYRDALFRESGEMLNRFPDATEECADVLRRVRDKAEKALPDRVPELTWPWDPEAPSTRTILSECLGASLGPAAAAPFSDLITVFPARGGDAIGDSYFGVMCSVLPFSSGASAESAPESVPEAAPEAAVVTPDAVLPPLSPAFTAAICGSAEGRVLLTPDFIRLDHPDDHSFRVILTLNGAVSLKLVRIYGEEEIIFMYANDLPTLALWPSIPFPENQWHAWYVYAHLPESLRLSVLPAGSSLPVSVDSDSARCTAAFDHFPDAFLFFREERSVGVLPNLLPMPELPAAGPVVACVDFGSAATSVVLASGDTREPLHGATMVRILLNNPATTPDVLCREFLPAVPVSALLPSVARMFGKSDDPVPFRDGIVLMSRTIRDVAELPRDELSVCQKWEDPDTRQDLLCLHQIMLMTALQARIQGSSGLSWRFAVPDEMPSGSREALVSLLTRLSGKVLEESGFRESGPGEPGLDGLLTLPITFASESAALGAYFRFCAREDTRGGFMVLDLGACTADISLFLRGRAQAARSCQIPLGVHYMLLPSLLQDPMLLFREFGAWPDPVFQADLNTLTRLLDSARSETADLPKVRLALDHFLSDHYPALVSALGQLSAAGIPSRFGAVLLLHLSYLTMLSGLVLLQLAADPNKNDFLPERMSLCLAGRGALLIEALPDPLKAELWRFLTMFRNKRVASLSLLFSAEKKMEIPVGLSLLTNAAPQLPASSAAPASISVRPEELLPEFLLRFGRVFPREAALLFPGLFSTDYYHPFSPAGEAAVTESIDRAFAARDLPRPYDSLARWITVFLEKVTPDNQENI